MKELKNEPNILSLQKVYKEKQKELTIIKLVFKYFKDGDLYSFLKSKPKGRPLDLDTSLDFIS
jgi:serine/threonine protein kinase